MIGIPASIGCNELLEFIMPYKYVKRHILSSFENLKYLFLNFK